MHKLIIATAIATSAMSTGIWDRVVNGERLFEKSSGAADQHTL